MVWKRQQQGGAETTGALKVKVSPMTPVCLARGVGGGGREVAFTGKDETAVVASWWGRRADENYSV